MANETAQRVGTYPKVPVVSPKLKPAAVTRRVSTRKKERENKVSMSKSRTHKISLVITPKFNR